jgi:hypothetical protein
MRREIGQPEPGPAFCGARAVGLLELLEDLLPVRLAIPGTVSAPTRERSVHRPCLDQHLPGVRELDRVARQVQQHLR